MFLTVRAAATQLGTSKSSVFRAIRTGKLSATRDEDGGYMIDPAELSRAFGAERPTPRHAPQDGAGFGAGVVSGDAMEFRIRAAALEAELRAVRELADELRQDRDRWHGEAASWKGQAERLLLSSPLVTPAPTSTPQPRQSWWSRWRQAG